MNRFKYNVKAPINAGTPFDLWAIGRRLAFGVLFKTVRPLVLSLLTIAMGSVGVRAANNSLQNWVFSPLPDHWTGYSTPHFALYSTNDRSDSAVEILRRLESARTLFDRLGILKPNVKSIVQVMAFGSDDEYKSYRLNAGAFAYYLPTQTSDLIVMRDLNPTHYEVALHEFTHFVLVRSGFNLPLWLNEGLADLYSTVEVHREVISIGRPPASRLNFLIDKPLLSLGTVIAQTRESAYSKSRGEILTFYATSWALTHMLALDPNYEQGFSRFLYAVSNGHSAEECFQSIFHKTLTEVNNDLDAYLRGRSLRQQQLVLDLPIEQLKPQIVRNSKEPAEVVLAQLVAANPQTVEDGKRMLLSLAIVYPKNVTLEESLGYVSLSDGDQASARRHFERAIEMQSQNPEIMLRLADLQLGAGAPVESLITLLKRAIELDPSSDKARLELAIVAAKAKRFALAISTLRNTEVFRPQDAYVFSYTLASLYLQIGQLSQARLFALRAMSIAPNRIERDRVGLLLSAVD